MPLVTVRVTGGESAPTLEQKEIIIESITNLLRDVLGKNPATTFVIIDEVDTDNWGIGGETVTKRRAKPSK